MSDATKLSIICCLGNAITVVCFTVLSIVFNKWWIVFFSFWFFSKVELEKVR